MIILPNQIKMTSKNIFKIKILLFKDKAIKIQITRISKKKCKKNIQKKKKLNIFLFKLSLFLEKNAEPNKPNSRDGVVERTAHDKSENYILETLRHECEDGPCRRHLPH